MKFYYLGIILNCFIHFTSSTYNRIIRVDGINPTCEERPNCRDYEVSGALINVDKSLPYMGCSTCCILFDAEDTTNQLFMVRILQPTFLGGEDYISVFQNDFNEMIVNITTVDKDPYRVIFVNSSKIIVEFHKDKNFRSVFDILVTAYYNGSSRKCLKDKYQCEESNICIDKDLECDRFPHCSKNEDEEGSCESLKMTDADFRPNISLALSILIGFTCLMIVSSILCCVCRRKTISSVGGYATNPFMRIFGYQVNAHFYRTSSSSSSRQQQQQEQQSSRLNRNKRNFGIPTTSAGISMNNNNRQNPPSYEEAKLIECKD